MFTVLTIVMIVVAWRLRDGAERKETAAMRWRSR
jgi:hypothetical protein